jgi:hypothetical protein
MYLGVPTTLRFVICSTVGDDKLDLFFIRLRLLSLLCVEKQKKLFFQCIKPAVFCRETSREAHVYIPHRSRNASQRLSSLREKQTVVSCLAVCKASSAEWQSTPFSPAVLARWRLSSPSAPSSSARARAATTPRSPSSYPRSPWTGCCSESSQPLSLERELHS